MRLPPEEPDLLATRATGDVSFPGACPCSVSRIDFAERDDWNVANMIRHLMYENGDPRFYATTCVAR